LEQPGLIFRYTKEGKRQGRSQDLTIGGAKKAMTAYRFFLQDEQHGNKNLYPT
jgi:hypothetical protein